MSSLLRWKMACYQSVLRGVPSLDSSNNLLITLPNVFMLRNGDTLRFVITSTVPTTSPLGTVSIVINGQTIPLKTRFGNNVRTQQLVARKLYTIGFGAETPSFTTLTCLPVSSFAFTTIPAPSAG